MEAWGVDVVIVHTGFDDRHLEIGKPPLDDLAQVRSAVKLPLQAVGAFRSIRRRGCRGWGRRSS
jgi:3-hexulose-6-phosphate synthase/6-phospho-3-hexuloisomerase